VSHTCKESYAARGRTASRFHYGGFFGPGPTHAAEALKPPPTIFLDPRAQPVHLHVYLDDDFDGGATSFRDDGGFTVDGVLRITPVKGMVLVFHHPIWHRGDPVTAGRNYVLRTDVMYRRSS